jgi:hypothetical protein
MLGLIVGLTEIHKPVFTLIVYDKCPGCPGAVGTDRIDVTFRS